MVKELILVLKGPNPPSESGFKKKVISLEILKGIYFKSSTFRVVIIDIALMEILSALREGTQTTLHSASNQILSALSPTALNQWEAKVHSLTLEFLKKCLDPKFMPLYPKLVVFQDHFQQSSHLDSRIEPLPPQTSSSRVEQKSKEIRLKKYLSILSNEFNAVLEKIKEHTIQVDTLLDILLPKSIFEPDLDQMKGDQSIFQHPPTFQMTVNINPSQTLFEVIQETRENSVLFDQLREHRQILLLQKSKINEWISLFQKVDDSDLVRHEKALKTLIDTKTQLNEILDKARELLNVATISVSLNDSQDDESEEEEFQEISADADRPLIHIDDEPESKSEMIQKANELVVPVKSFTGFKPVYPITNPSAQDPTTIPSKSTTSTSTMEKPPLDQKSKLYEKAPIVEWQPDLDYWSTKTITFSDISTHGGVEYKHRFLGESAEPSSEKVVGEDVVNQLRKRMVVIQEPGGSSVQEYPICGAPTKDGKRCMRRDMEKWPFHGPKRDWTGGSSSSKDPAIWKDIQDQVLDHNIEAAGSSSRQRRGQRRSTLTNMKPKESVRTRLGKKMAKMAKNSVQDDARIIQELVQRDKQVFRW